MTRRLGSDAVGGVFIGLASLQFGGVVVLGKLLTEAHLPIPSFLAIRFAIVAVLLALLAAASRQPLLPAPGERLPLAALGMVGYAVEAALFFAALEHGGAAAVTLLFFTYPVWVALLSMALGRGRPTRLVLLALACAVAGAAVVVLGSGGLEIALAGVVFALASAATFSLYLTGADLVLKRTNSQSGAMWVGGSASLSLAVYAIAAGAADLPNRGVGWAQVVGAGALTAGAFVCLFAGLRRLGSVRTSIVAATEPLAASVLAVLFLGEPLRLATVTGGALILAGAVAASLARRAPPPVASAPPP